MVVELLQPVIAAREDYNKEGEETRETLEFAIPTWEHF